MRIVRRLAALLLLLLAVPAAAQTFPELTGRVVDQANIIPDDREAALSQLLEELETATSRQLVVATVASLEGQEVEDYAYRLGRHWRIGQAEADNGVVLLVAPNERKVFIAVGPGLQGILTDAFSGRVIREQLLPRFRENDYPGGIEAGVAALATQLAAPPEQAEQRLLDAEKSQEPAASEGGSSSVWTGLTIVVVFLVGGFIVLLVIGAIATANDPPTGKRGRRGSASSWGYAGASDSGSSWSSSSDSWSSSSSWSSSDSGFSGGGGSFDGGGAGGSW